MKKLTHVLVTLLPIICCLFASPELALVLFGLNAPELASLPTVQRGS